MKKFFFILAILFPILCYSQNEVTNCTLDSIPTDQIPNYLNPDWNSVRIGKFAVLYVDFPDGRYINGSDTLQPFYDNQLEWVYNNGEPDAAGEMGLVNEPTNIPVGDKYMKASKYTWYDRWNMFFDSLGVYTGNAHPDWASHGDSAWGSMKQYWKDASNGKFEMIPYVTHDREQDYRLRTGIINGYQMVNGVPVISCLKMPKKKYGTSDQNSYLRGHNINDDLISAALNMIGDAQNLVRTKTNFNLDQFYGEGGVLFIYFAGSHGGLKDIGTISPKVSIVRLREGAITDPSSRIDGFGVSAHQYGHIEFGWSHTNSGRCDIMNGGDVHDNNSPQYPNPIYRMRLGWLQPIAMESTQQVNNLLPVETSHQCGVVTIYGKPSAAPDWSTGESYIVENRRRLKFDRYIVDKSILPLYPNFKGGLLVWHYSPYNPISTIAGTDLSIKFHSADTNTNLLGNRGNPTSFFAYDVNASYQYKNFDTSRTYSGGNVKTGIELKNIAQLNYNDINSSIRFNLNYLISEPAVYNYIIYPKGGSIRIVTLSNKVFYHNIDNKEYYKILPGTIIDVGTRVTVNNMEARGTQASNITFKGPGYSNSQVSYFNHNPGILFSSNNTAYMDVDSSILENVKILNTKNGTKELVCSSASLPVVLKNVSVTSNFSSIGDYDIELTANNNISGFNLSNAQILVRSTNKFYGPTIINTSRATFYGNTFFDSVLSMTNSTLDNNYMNVRPFFKFDKMPNKANWEGVKLQGGGVNLIKFQSLPVIKNAMTAINAVNPSGLVHIEGITFEDNANYDIVIYSPTIEMMDNPKIKGNTLFQANGADTKIASILVSECPNVIIDSNIINDPGYFGIISMNNDAPFIGKNTIIGGNLGVSSTGIFSYKSNGYYKCNEILKFTRYGIELDNSQPMFFNNTIYANGLGLFLTNNSNPIMDPTYTGDILCGYNWIHHNAGEEIYCNNSKHNTSIPYLYKGYNSIEDVNESRDILIFNKEISGVAPTIECPENYWGGDSPEGRLIPEYSFRYDSYLTEPLSYACDFVSKPTGNLILESQYSSDKPDIESKIKENRLADVISEYNSFINSNDDEEMKFYASIDKSRVIRLFLDRLLSKIGDNVSNSEVDRLYNEAIYYNVNKNLSRKESKAEIKNKYGKISEEKELNSAMNPISERFLSLQKNLSDKLKNFNSLNKNEKRTLIIEKNILDIAVNNNIEGIESIKEKLLFLNKEISEIPQQYTLNQNFPNPFNPSTTISYVIPKEGFVKIKVFDITGREVMTLINDFKTAGSYSIDFNGSNFSSGIYFYQLESGDFIQTRKMLLIK